VFGRIVQGRRIILITYLSNFLEPSSEGLVSIAHGLVDGRNFVDVRAQHLVGITDPLDDLPAENSKQGFVSYNIAN